MKYVYILRSLKFPEQIYVGVTTDLSKRLSDHNSGKCKHTTKYKPWNIVYFEESITPYSRERQIKKWARAKKEALIAGDVNKLKLLSKKIALRCSRYAPLLRAPFDSR